MENWFQKYLGALLAMLLLVMLVYSERKEPGSENVFSTLLTSKPATMTQSA